MLLIFSSAYDYCLVTVEEGEEKFSPTVRHDCIIERYVPPEDLGLGVERKWPTSSCLKAVNEEKSQSYLLSNLAIVSALARL